MTHELDLYGVFVSPLLASAALAFLLAWPVRRLLRRLGCYRWVWHQALFDTALFVILLGAVSAVAGWAAAGEIVVP